MQQLELIQQRPQIKRLADRDTPTARINALGPLALSTIEILAIIIGGPKQIEIAQTVYLHWRHPQELKNVPNQTLCNISGVGPQTAARIAAAFELGRRAMLDDHEEKPRINSPQDAAALVQYEMSGLEQEELRIIILNTRNAVQAIETLYRGSLNSSQVRVAEVFKTAIRINAAAIIVIHNHPSGDPTPSPEDLAITRAIIDAGKLLDIQILDHLVIGAGRFVSLKERGLAFG